MVMKLKFQGLAFSVVYYIGLLFLCELDWVRAYVCCTRGEGGGSLSLAAVPHLRE